VEGYLKSLRPKQQEEYQTAFEEAETARAAQARSKAPPHKERGGGPPSGQGRSQSRAVPPPTTQSELVGADDEEEDDDASVDEYTCPFCGIVDDAFDSDRLDQHFWAQCRMLTPCKMCGQVIEISGLNEHLLVECELKKNHKECARCGEAITVKFYDKHMGLNDCPPRPNPTRANRCPLCHEDIAPGKKGWKRHLLDETCPNNPRG
jgi:centrosomal protein CEP104